MSCCAYPTPLSVPYRLVCGPELGAVTGAIEPIQAVGEYCLARRSSFTSLPSASDLDYDYVLLRLSPYPVITISHLLPPPLTPFLADSAVGRSRRPLGESALA